MADAVRVREVGTVERTTHNKVGDVTQTVDGLGNETISLYDRRARLTSTYEPLRDPNVTPWRPTPVDNPTSGDWTTVSDSRAYGGSYLCANGSSRSVLKNWDRHRVATVFDKFSSTVLGASPIFQRQLEHVSDLHDGRAVAQLLPDAGGEATWVPDEDNIRNALFRVFDNFNNEIGSIYVDQTVAPGDYRDETGRWWAVLGGHCIDAQVFATANLRSERHGYLVRRGAAGWAFPRGSVGARQSGNEIRKNCGLAGER